MFVVRFFNKKLLFALLLATSFSAEIKPFNFQNPEYREGFLISSFIGASIIGIGAGHISDKVNALWVTLENKLIKQWLKQNSLNRYGEPKKPFEFGVPLKEFQILFDYIKGEFPKKPWLHDYKDVFKTLKWVNNISTFLWLCGLVSMISITIGHNYLLVNG